MANLKRNIRQVLLVLALPLVLVVALAVDQARATTLSLVPGWNLLGSRAAISAGSMFANDGAFVSVWKWQNGTWAVFLPGQNSAAYADSKGFAVLSAIAPGEGFWLNSKVASTLTVSGDEVTTETLTLYPGWNLKSLTVPGAVEVSSCLGEADKIASVWKWQAGSWAVYLPGDGDGGAQYAAGKGFFTLQTITEGEGFWVNSLLDASWSVPLTPPATASFSPILSADSSVPLSWKYQINGGLPLAVTIEGIPVSFSFSDLVQTIDPATLIRQGSYSGSITGGASGSFTVGVSEELESLAEISLIKSQEMTMDMSLFAYGQSVFIGLDVLMDFSPAAEWFLDRSDLDQLPIGYVYNEFGVVYGTVSGSMTVSGYGTTTLPATTITSPEKWTIVGKEESVVVKGKSYTNVVKVKRTTIMPTMDLSGANQQLEITYWVAKGIGMVKGEGYLQMYGQQLTIELLETNLTQ